MNGDRIIRNLQVFICTHGNRPAVDCPGKACAPMEGAEIVRWVRIQIPFTNAFPSELLEYKRILLAFDLGKRIGWAKNEP